MGKRLGIDLGTTFSAMAIVNDQGVAEIVPNREGERVTPSVVLFEEEGPVIGTLAKQAAAEMPLAVCQFVKRKMGERITAFRTESGEKLTPEAVSALILKRLHEDACQTLGEQIESAVVTVPAYFNDSQRKATEDAGIIAGLNVIAVINEPTAAALAYGVGKQHAGETAVVYDLGGGTFDVTVVKVSDNLVEVLSTCGDKNLGGFDWDNALMSLIAERACGESAAEALADPAFAQDLRNKAEVAKKTLSGRDVATIRVTYEGKTNRIEISRAEFEEATKGLMRRTEHFLEAALDDASLTWSDIQKVLLVGGSTRMPAVSERIEALSGIKPSRELHPDEVVALGAAYYADQLAARPDSKEITRIEDVCSHSLGIITVGDDNRTEINSIVLKKDTKIPGEARDTFHTVQDQQTKLQLRVTQGEDSEIKYVHVIGESMMNIPPYPRGAPLEVTFSYDENALIKVFVKDLTSGERLGEMEIERKANLSQEERTSLVQRVAGIEVN